MSRRHHAASSDSEPSADAASEDPSQPDQDEPAVWCDTCEAMVAIADLDQDDCCPRCGERVGPRKVPLKFKLMIAATVVYLGYRAFQGITWVIHHG